MSFRFPYKAGDWFEHDGVMRVIADVSCVQASGYVSVRFEGESLWRDLGFVGTPITSIEDHRRKKELDALRARLGIGTED